MKKLLMFAVVGGVAVAAAKVIEQQKAQWQGLTEAEARRKLDAKIPDAVPSDKRTEIADKIVSGMRDKGVLADAGATTPSDNDATPEGSVTPDNEGHSDSL